MKKNEPISSIMTKEVVTLSLKGYALFGRKENENTPYQTHACCGK